MSRSQTDWTASRGFTLIELLVVISIIALLMGLLLPVLGKAKDSTKATICQNHQRQLGLATVGYQHDYQGQFPQPSQDSDIPGGTSVRNAAVWFNALDPYLAMNSKSYASPSERNYAEFKQCPVWKDFPEQEGSTQVRRDARTIKMNSFLGDTNDDLPNNPSQWRFFRDMEIKKPSLTVVYFDGRSYDIRNTSGGWDSSGSGNFNGEEIYVGPRHDRGVNVTFADGHGSRIVQEIRMTTYPGWFAGPTANGAAAGPQKLNWLRLGRGNVFDN